MLYVREVDFESESCVMFFYFLMMVVVVVFDMSEAWKIRRCVFSYVGHAHLHGIDGSSRRERFAKSSASNHARSPCQELCRNRGT